MRIICLVLFSALSVASVSFAGQLTRLYAFTGGADGKYPSGPLLLDSAGNLYGVTVEGGIGYGTVYRLSPPLEEGAPWTETVLHTFTGGPSDGTSPGGNLVLDSAGNLSGVAEGGGLTTCLGGSSIGCGVAFRISRVWSTPFFMNSAACRQTAGPPKANSRWIRRVRSMAQPNLAARAHTVPERSIN
jgi:uncharacterized repeat protein (TIGR03803 family)